MKGKKKIHEGREFKGNCAKAVANKQGMSCAKELD